MNANPKSLATLPSLALDRILYATDFSQASLAALPLISTIAKKYGSHLFVAHVWTPPPYTMITAESEVELKELEENRARDRAMQLLTTKALAGVPATVVVRSGSPLEEIATIVREQKIDLVILATHGRSGLKHVLMGSVAEELLRNLTCPVLTVGPHVSKESMEQTQVRHILVPTDLSDVSRAALPLVSSLAADYEAPITLLRVLPTETASNPGAMAELERRKMQEMFSFVGRPGCIAEFLVDFGSPLERTLSHASRMNTGLIVLGVRSAEPITTRFRASLPYRLILEAHCPVLTIKQSHAEAQS